MITATLTASRFQVVSAQINSWVDSFGRTRALDLFWVKSGSNAESVAAIVARVERRLPAPPGQSSRPADLVTGGNRKSRWSDRPTPGCRPR